MRPLAALILASALAGCIEDQSKQAASCQVDGARTFPTKTLRGDSPSIDLADYIQACMRKEGYVFTCSYQNLSAIPSCYEPNGTLARWVFSVESRMRNSN